MYKKKSARAVYIATLEHYQHYQKKQKHLANHE